MTASLADVGKRPAGGTQEWDQCPALYQGTASAVP
jgi:hypothetical protein